MASHVVGNDGLVHRWMHDDQRSAYLLECHWHWPRKCTPKMIRSTDVPLTCTACIAGRTYVR